MNSRKRGLVIRTVFNNQGWSGPCKKPLNDYRCFKCVTKSGLYINWGKPINEDNNHFCKGESKDDPKLGEHCCWEQTLCKEYWWKNVIGKWRYARVGMPVYFVFFTHDGSLTLWGHSVIDSIDNNVYDKKLAMLKFKPFTPLSEDKWVKGLTGQQITGKLWKQLFYRYLDEAHERYLSSLVKGEKNIESVKNNVSETPNIFNINLREDIKGKIQKIANNEGREFADVIREAVAKLIRERGL